MEAHRSLAAGHFGNYSYLRFGDDFPGYAL